MKGNDGSVAVDRFVGLSAGLIDVNPNDARIDILSITRDYFFRASHPTVALYRFPRPSRREAERIKSKCFAMKKRAPVGRGLAT